MLLAKSGSKIARRLLALLGLLETLGGRSGGPMELSNLYKLPVGQVRQPNIDLDFE